MTTTAVIYTRVSTEEQARDGYGLAAQQEKTKAMATVKGWTIGQEYSDPGISGTIEPEHRPGLAKLLQDAGEGKIEAVIFSSLDRIGRKTKIILETIERLKDQGVTIVSCKESLDTETPTGQFVLTIFAGLAQLERDNIVQRTTDGRNERGKIDGEKGGNVPYGYMREKYIDDATGKTKTRVLIDHDAVPTIKLIFDRRSLGKKGGGTYQAIVDYLNAEGILGPTGKTWHMSAVRRVLATQEAYSGGFRGESKVHWPRIL